MNKFLDFDKNNHVFYYNIYLKDSKIVVKMPLSGFKKEKHIEEIKMEKFELTKYTFLLNCK